MDEVMRQREQAVRQYSMRTVQRDPFESLMWFCPDCTTPLVSDNGECWKCKREVFVMCADPNCKKVYSDSIEKFNVDHMTCYKSGHKIVASPTNPVEPVQRDQVSVNNFERLIQTTPTHLSHHQALVTVENKKRKKSVDDEDASEAKKRKTIRDEIMSCSFNEQTEKIVAAVKKQRALEKRLSMLKNPTTETLDELTIEEIDELSKKIEGALKVMKKLRDERFKEEILQKDGWRARQEAQQQSLPSYVSAPVKTPIHQNEEHEDSSDEGTCIIS